MKTQEGQTLFPTLLKIYVFLVCSSTPSSSLDVV